MSSTDRDLVDKIARSGDEHAAPQGWQEKVWRRVREPEVMVATMRPRPWFAWPLACAVTVALAAVGFLVMQDRDTARAKKQEIAMAKSLKAQIEWEQEIERTMREIDALQQEMDAAFSALEAAEDERARMEAMRAQRQAMRQLAASRAELQRLRLRGIAKSKREKKAKARKEKNLIDKCAGSNDPLCGI